MISFMQISQRIQISDQILEICLAQRIIQLEKNLGKSSFCSTTTKIARLAHVDRNSCAKNLNLRPFKERDFTWFYQLISERLKAHRNSRTTFKFKKIYSKNRIFFYFFFFDLNNSKMVSFIWVLLREMKKVRIIISPVVYLK